MSDGNIMNASWTLILSYQGSKVSKSKSLKSTSKKRKRKDETTPNSLDKETNAPSIKSKGVKVKEHALVIPKKSKYYEEPKGKQLV